MNLIKRLLQSFRLFWGGMLEQPQPVRVGMLDTGELALVGDRDETQVLSVRTTNTIRRTLAAHPAPGPLASAVDATDPVHWALHQARKAPAGTIARRPE